MKNYIEITYSQFEDTYRPTDEFFSDYQDALESVGGQHTKVWTVRDGDGRYTIVTNGYGFVNRLEYMTTEVPWKDGDDIFVSHD